MKKRILSAFLVLCMMLTMVPTAALAAEDPGGGNGSDRVHTESNDGIVVDKTVNYDGDGNYSLTLEAYVTNEVTKGSKTTPLDIVLVLDVSGSMMMTWERARGNIPPLMNRDGRIATSTGLGGRRIISAMMTATTTKWKLKVMVLGGTGNIPSGIIPAAGFTGTGISSVLPAGTRMPTFGQVLFTRAKR